MRGIKTTTISILAIGLLAGSVVGAAAQGEDAATFTVEFEGPPVEFGFDEPTGRELLVINTESTDPRASGVLSLQAARGGIEDEGTRYQVSKEGVRLANDDGA